MVKRIHLISGPRNISTALMYSFAHRRDCEVVDEPFYAHYLDRTSKVHPGRAEVLASMPVDPTEISKRINQPCLKEVLFVKDMAHHLSGVDLGQLGPAYYVFLIRHPSLMINSFTKVIPDIEVADLALPDQVMLFDDFVQRGYTPLVLDGSDVLRNPELTLRALCRAVDIPFDAGMLAWDPGPIPQDGVWAKHWYDSVHASSGWIVKEEMPQAVASPYEEVYSEALTLFRYLKQHQTI
jgi:hypothetical protein